MTQAIQTTNQQPKQLSIKQMVENPAMVQRLAKVAHSAIKPDRLAQALLFAVNRNSDLQRCSVQSLFDCLTIATQYGWSIGGPRPGMYIVPYGQVATPIPSYFGLQQTARESSDEWEIESDVVREGDDFFYQKGLTPKLDHRPHDDESAITHAYAIARSKSGRTKFDVMPTSAVEAIRARSKAGQSGPWKTDWAEMAKKTVVRRLCKYLPSSPALEAALDISDRAERGDDLEATAAAPTVNRTYARSKELADENESGNGGVSAPVSGTGPSHEPMSKDAPSPDPSPAGNAPAGAHAPAGAGDSPTIAAPAPRGRPSRKADSTPSAPQAEHSPHPEAAEGGGGTDEPGETTRKGTASTDETTAAPQGKPLTPREQAMEFSEGAPLNEIEGFLAANEARMGRAKTLVKVTGGLEDFDEKTKRKLAFYVQLAILEKK